MDVGGTFTKGVALDAATGEILASSTVPTTHSAERGVSEGIVDALGRLVAGSGIRLDEIELISHSTTQAINALLESDTHKVGIVAMGVGPEKRDVVKRTRLGGGGTGAGRRGLRSAHRFLDTSRLITGEDVRAAVDGLRGEGAEVVVAAEAFGVDDPSNEDFVAERAAEMGLPATCSHEVSGAYGLEIRTLTAAVNASVLPKTLRVARYVEGAVRDAGARAPLMVMKGDGGVTSMETFRTTPILTVLSGPAASVAGALLYLRASNAVFVEVGGTSTNVCVIRNGRPEMRYVTIKDHPTCVRSLDVRVLGVAGGSMVALRGGRVDRVGPRSAHVAGMRYSCYADPGELRGGRVVKVAPREGDEEEYAAIECAGGRTYAITNTCAANALGLVEEGDYAHAGGDAARAALAKLGDAVGVSYSEAAFSVMQISAFEVTAAVSKALKEFRMKRSAARIIGGGGGASVLVPFVAKRLGIPYEKAAHAEVISSIGVASSMMREEAEVAMSEPSPGLVSGAHRKVHEAIVAKGAVPESVVVDSEFFPEKSVLRVAAVGSVGMDGAAAPWAAGRGRFGAEEARLRAAEIMGMDPDQVDMPFESGHHMVFVGHATEKRLFSRRNRHHVVVLDRHGRQKLSYRNGRVMQGGAISLVEDLDDYLESRGSGIAPQVCLVNEMQMMDFSGLTSPAHMLEAVMAEVGTGAAPGAGAAAPGRAAVIVDMS